MGEQEGSAGRMTDKTGAWVVGYNRPGYMPETDTDAFAEWSDAVSVLKETALEYADTDDDAAYQTLSETAVRADYPDFENSGYGDDEPSMKATVQAIIRDEIEPLSLNADRDVTFTVSDNDDRPMVFWVQWSTDRTPDEDDS
jgi:hypothetical protein